MNENRLDFFTEVIETWPLTHSPELTRVRARGALYANHVSRPMFELIPQPTSLRNHHRMIGCVCQNIAYSDPCGGHE